MRRFVLCFALALTAVSASASYKIYLVTGETILADEKPQFKEGTAVFLKNGMTFTMPSAKIDFEKSEKAALAEAAAPKFEQIVTTSAPKPRPSGPVMRVDDQSIEKIRLRSRLANEDAFAPTEEGEGAGVPEGGKSREGGSAGNAESPRKQLMERLRQQEQDLVQAESNRNQLRNSVADLKQRYDSSVQQEEKASLWSQYESTRDQLTSANSQVDEAQAQVQGTKSEIGHLQPEVIMVGEAPPAPADNAPAGK